jgi:hypothetical protein
VNTTKPLAEEQHHVILNTALFCELLFSVSSCSGLLYISKRNVSLRKGCRSRPAASAAAIGSSFERLLGCTTCTYLSPLRKAS